MKISSCGDHHECQAFHEFYCETQVWAHLCQNIVQFSRFVVLAQFSKSLLQTQSKQDTPTANKIKVAVSEFCLWASLLVSHGPSHRTKSLGGWAAISCEWAVASLSHSWPGIAQALEGDNQSAWESPASLAVGSSLLLVWIDRNGTIGGWWIEQLQDGCVVEATDSSVGSPRP